MALRIDTYRSNTHSSRAATRLSGIRSVETFEGALQVGTENVGNREAQYFDEKLNSGFF